MLEAMRLAVEFLETILVHLYVALEPIYIRVASVIQAELRVILLGPKLAWSRGYRRISVDSGSLNMLKML